MPVTSLVLHLAVAYRELSPPTLLAFQALPSIPVMEDTGQGQHFAAPVLFPYDARIEGIWYLLQL